VGGAEVAVLPGLQASAGEVDAGIRFEFLKEKKASITLNISDVFRTDANNAYSESFISHRTLTGFVIPSFSG
jgi:hypothetical protein